MNCRLKRSGRKSVELIDEGATIPFIARYRKEVTGSLNDEQLRALSERLVYLRNLEEKKASVLATIEEQGKLTDELKKQIEAVMTMVALEDLYRPYRPKRRTRATIAKEKGLEPLAEILRAQATTRTIEEEATALLMQKKAWKAYRMPSTEPRIFSQKCMRMMRITGRSFVR